MAAARRKVDLDALERDGFIVRRSAYFYRSSSVFSLNSAELAELTTRVKARVPRGSDINVIVSDTATYLTGDGWRSKLVKTGESRDRSVFEFWFADMKWSMRDWPVAQMNIAATAVETAFLLTDPYTLVDSRFAPSKARDFDITEDLSNTSVFDTVEIGRDLAEFVEAPIGVGLPLKAVELGSNVGKNILDSMFTRFVNDAANPGNHVEFLLQHYIGSPALPPKLRQASQDFVTYMTGERTRSNAHSDNRVEAPATAPAGAHDDASATALVDANDDSPASIRTDAHAKDCENDHAEDHESNHLTTPEETRADALAGQEANQVDEADGVSSRVEEGPWDASALTILCPRCGRKNKPNMRYCAICGWPLKTER